MSNLENFFVSFFFLLDFGDGWTSFTGFGLFCSFGEEVILNIYCYYLVISIVFPLPVLYLLDDLRSSVVLQESSLLSVAQSFPEPLLGSFGPL